MSSQLVSNPSRIGFGYNFDAVKMGNSNELVQGFNDVFAHHQKVSYWQILVTLFPVFGRIVSVSRIHQCGRLELNLSLIL